MIRARLINRLAGRVLANTSGVVPRFFSSAVRPSGLVGSQLPKRVYQAPQFSTQGDQIFQLVTAASTGDLKTIQELVKKGVDLNAGDYDRRTALHLACAEGKMNVVEYLIKNKVNLNCQDRFGSRPLDDAFEGNHDNIIDLLLKNGAARLEPDRLVSIMNDAASKNDVERMTRILKIGGSVVMGDYDQRTPLHLASSEGHMEACKFLIENGANPNCVDRFGGTPIQDVLRQRGPHSKKIVAFLTEHGGVTRPEDEAFSGPSLPGACASSLQFLCERSKFSIGEVWMPTAQKTEFIRVGSFCDHDDPAQNNFVAAGEGIIEPNLVTSLLGQIFAGKREAIIPKLDQASCQNRAKLAADAGLKAGVVIPIMHSDKVYALMVFYNASTTFENVNAAAFGMEMHNDSLKAMAELRVFASRIVSAYIFESAYKPQFMIPVTEKSDHDFLHNMARYIYQRIASMGVFPSNLVYNELDWFFGLGLQEYYFKRFSPDIIANHIHTYIASKKFAATTAKPESIWVYIENNPKMLGPGGREQALYMIPAETKKLAAVERQLELIIQRVPNDRCYSMEFFLSRRPLIAQGTKKLGIYVLETHEYACLESIGNAAVTDIKKCASKKFLEDKPANIIERYQNIITQTTSQLSTVCNVYEPHAKDGTIPIMFAWQHGHGDKNNYLVHLTEMMNQNGLLCFRKFIENFSNGVTVFSLYLFPGADVKVTQRALNRLVNQFSMLQLTPKSVLTPYFLRGDYSAEKYTYTTAISRFIYYFINQHSDEYSALSRHLAADPVNLSRLRLLHTSLKREAVSIDRIYSSFHIHNDMISTLYEDFNNRISSRDALSAAEMTKKTKLLETQINKNAKSPLDAQVLHAILRFNNNLAKTNFYKAKKSALSFRLEPGAFGEVDWPQIPFGLFFVMGADFQAFHCRFRDVSRGGIRIVQSRDEHHYMNNMSSLFSEVYGLAYTQNKKNKDIPEFGSKGAILLFPGSQGNAFIAFRKYISSLLDLLVIEGQTFNHYNKEEFLFLGPDEGTANMMQWAAEYAKTRKYSYWRSFTTGKPQFMGGIPHDIYGMTTRSVHRFVVGTLKKLGLRESDVTKCQTGGPDGDLGSNEILISNDKTLSVVDGAGVVYDPNGLNRDELVRLAQLRVMIDKFDLSKLSKGGFRVLVGENNVTLPNGEVVDSGVKFRNEFHLHPLSSADLFVPCGGRPESVNLSNVHRLFDEKGKPRFKYIIEGANLFLTNDARLTLENAGVILFKDASTNKGGVTSSSLEVLAGLAIPEDLFKQNMVVQDVHNIPDFYAEYVKAIITRIENDADLEFECIWREHERTGIARHILTERVSDKINELNDFVQASSLWEDKKITNAVLQKALPKSLQTLVGMEKILENVPDAYIKAIFGCYIASRYVYRYGINANEFAFFEFMQEYIAGTPVAKK